MKLSNAAGGDGVTGQYKVVGVSRQQRIADLRKENGQNLKEFLGWLKDQEKEFRKNKNKDLSFADFLQKKVPHAPLATN